MSCCAGFCSATFPGALPWLKSDRQSLWARRVESQHQSRTVCNPTLSAIAASCRVTPAQTTAKAKRLRTCAASPLPRAKARKSDAEKSCQSPIAEPIATPYSLQQ